MTANPGVEVDELRSASHAAADAAAGASIVSEVSIASAAATETRTHQPRAANGRFVVGPPGSAPVADEDEVLQADRFLDREISWLQFNERVLQLAADENVPLLERARYLAIFASNLDEFFMVRVAGLKRRIATGIAVRSASGLEPREVLEQISLVAHELLAMQARVYGTQVRPALETAGITIVRWDELSDGRARPARRDVHRPALPGAHPAGRRPGPPVPLHLRALAQPGRRAGQPAHRQGALRAGQGAAGAAPPAARRARARTSRRWPTCTTPGSCRSRTSSRRTSTTSSRGWRCASTSPSGSPATRTSRSRRTTPRTSSPPWSASSPGAASARRCASRSRPTWTTTCSTCWCASSASPGPRSTACRPRSTCARLNVIADLERSDLHFDPFVARTNPDLAPTESAKARDIFASIRKQDILLQHPYDSFSTSVQAFIEQAAADPRVLAIKQTLYRTSGDSPIIDALIDAAEAGKQVLAVVEIKARFDEQNNISWARKLEHAGVHVVYGIVGLKTHAKLCLVIRQEAEGLRRYCHVGTGNYNPKTARLYEDLGLLTVDDQVGQDLTRLFNQLSGIAPRSRFKRLLVAPAVGALGPDRPDRRRDRARAAPARLGAHRLEGQLDRRRAAHRRALPRLAGRA